MLLLFVVGWSDCHDEEIVRSKPHVAAIEVQLLACKYILEIIP
jgi:hypothetical protein